MGGLYGVNFDISAGVDPFLLPPGVKVPAVLGAKGALSPNEWRSEQDIPKILEIFEVTAAVIRG